MSKFSGIIAERFNRMNAGQQAKILALIERHDDSRAIEAEVLQAQEPVGCVLYYEISPYRGVCGTTVGADGGGEFADVYFGDPEGCSTAARSKISDMERRGIRLKNASVLCNGDVYYYNGSHVSVTNIPPQPPAPCQKCTELQTQIGKDALNSLAAEDQYQEQVDALQAKVAELRAEVERLTTYKTDAYAALQKKNDELDALQSTIAQQAERIAAQAALLEQCEKACEAFGKTLETDVGENFAEEIRALCDEVDL